MSETKLKREEIAKLLGDPEIGRKLVSAAFRQKPGPHTVTVQTNNGEFEFQMTPIVPVDKTVQRSG